MSTGLLYHAWGLRGYRHVRTSYLGGQVIFAVEQPRERYHCSACGSPEVIGQGGVEREFRTMPIGGKVVRLRLRVPRVLCYSCGLTRQVKIPFADQRKHYTRSLERYVLDLSRHMTIQDVARHLNLSWDTVKEIQSVSLKRRFGKPKLARLRQIAIDEISVGKGHHYLTVVLNLVSGAVVFVGDGKGADALAPFWRRLRASGAVIQAVATDMSPAYIEAVRTNLPGVVHVFDHFHVIKLFNEKLSDFRRMLHREAVDRLHKKVLKGTRWLLLKNPENLCAKNGERERLEEALRLNAPLATVYYLKEDLRQLWSQRNLTEARAVLADWIRRAEASGIRMLQQFARTLAMHREGILNWYRHRISTGPLEGTNTKIQLMKRQAYGFRDMAFFKLKILGAHETKYALVG